jgi:hypothetical protein
LTLVDGLYREVNHHTSSAGDSMALADAVVWEIVGASRLASMGQEEPRGDGTELDLRLLAAYLILHKAGKLATVVEHTPVTAAWYSDLGLERAFGELVNETKEGAGGTAYPLLLRLMLRWQDFFAARERQGAAVLMKLLLADQDVCTFLGVHSYEEREWFVKERFELFLEWLLVAEVVRLAAATIDDEELRPLLARIRKDSRFLVALAAEAGYRVDRFLSLLRDGALSLKANEDD